MIDLVLLEAVEQAVKGRPRLYVTAADVLACVEKESSGVAVFRNADHLLKANLAAAQKITGLTKEQIKKTCTITQGPLKGQIAKFRCEPGYWAWAQKYKSAFKNTDLFLLSCSFGLGQKMTRWYVTGVPVSDMIPQIRQFMGSIKLQLLYCAGDLDSLMKRTKGDKALAFTMYNAGPSAKKSWLAHRKYGEPVYKRSLVLAKEIKRIQDERTESIPRRAEGSEENTESNREPG